MNQIVRRITEELKDKGMSKAELCRRVGIPATTFSNYIVRGGCPRIEVLEDIADVLEVSVAYLRSGIKPEDNIREETEQLIMRIEMLPKETQKLVLKTISGYVGGLSK